MEEGYTYGYNNARDAVSLTPRKLIEPLLLPDQLMNLQRLSGYIKFPDGFPAAPVKLKPVGRPKVAETFIGRAKDRVVVLPLSPRSRPTAQSSPEAPDHPSANDDGAGKPVVPKQGSLPLEPGLAAQDRKEEKEPTKQGAKRLDPRSEPLREAKPRKGGKGAVDPSKRDKPGPAVPTEAVVRKSSGAAEKTPRADAPMVKLPANPSAAQQQVPRQNASDARKLMLEDGVPEQEPPLPSGPDLGDVEL